MSVEAELKNSIAYKTSGKKSSDAQHASSDVGRPSKGHEVKATKKEVDKEDGEASDHASVMPTTTSNISSTTRRVGLRIVNTPSFDLYYPAYKADDRQATYTRQSRTSFSLEAPPRVPVEGQLLFCCVFDFYMAGQGSIHFFLS